MRPIRTAALALAVSIAGLLLPTSAISTTAAQWLWSATEPVAPGVSREQVVAPLAGRELSINAIRIDSTAPGIAVETRMARDAALGQLEPLLAQTSRLSGDGHRVVAAINGGTFGCFGINLCSAGGLNVVDGELYGYRRNLRGEPAPTFAVVQGGTPLIGRPTLAVAAALPDGSIVPINAVNAPRKDGETVLYTPRWGTHTMADATGLEIVLAGGPPLLGVVGSHQTTVVEVRSGTADAPIEPGALVISASATTATSLASVAVGDSLTVTTAVDPGWEEVAFSVSGRETLVRDGSIDVAPVGLDASTTRHPRSAVGITADGGLILVTADGRQARSVGATVAEMAQLMIDLGAVEAINLDGGGSTQLAARRLGTVDAQIVNRPSSLSRPIANAVHVISHAPEGDLTGVAIAPGAQRLRVGESVQLSLGGHDAALNGVRADLGTVAWEVAGSAVSVDQAGAMVAVEPGEALVTARVGSWSASAPVTVVERLLEIGAPTVAFVPGGLPGQTSVPLRAAWMISPGGSPVARVELQRRTGSGSWRTVTLSTATASAHQMSFTFGRVYQLRVRARDTSGYLTPWSTGDPFRVEPLVADGTSFSASPGWTELAVTEAIGGTVERSSALGEQVELAMRQQPFAVVGQRGRRHGVAEIWVNGALQSTVNLRASSIRHRQLLYISTFAQAPSPEWTTVELRNASTGTRNIVDLDEILVIVTLR